MGVLSGKDLLSSKYTTAIIVNEDNRGFFVPIKYVIQNYFLAEIEKQLYCFRLEGSRQIIYRHTLVKSFKFYIFYTDHYMPVSPKEIKELEEVLKRNNLPKVSFSLFGMLKLLGKKEKHNQKEFTPHIISDLIELIGKEQEKYPEQTESMINFINEIPAEKISTPVKRASEFLEGDFLTTDPKWLSTIAEQLKRTDAEQKKMANIPVAGKIAWMKIFLIIGIIVMVVVIGYLIYTSGLIPNIGGSIGSIVPGGSGGQSTPQQLMQQYPTPEALKTACDRGDLDCSKLPHTMKDYMSHAKITTVTPKTTP